MTEKMGRWVRKSEERCRKCSILQGVNAEGYCERCWGERIVEFAQEEERKEAEAWALKREKERFIEETGDQQPPTLEERLTALEEDMAQLKAYLGLSRARMMR